MISNLTHTATGRALVATLLVVAAFAIGFLSRSFVRPTVAQAGRRVIPALLLPLAPVVLHAAGTVP